MNSQTTVDQRGAKAGRDVIGRDLNVHHHHAPALKELSVVELLLEKLQREIESNQQTRDMVEELRHFYTNKSHDGIDGLEAKLNHAGRTHEILDALVKKELFVKMLEKWSMYASAQEIWVQLLAKAVHEFSMQISPQLTTLAEVEINNLISSKIVYPTVSECGAGVFRMNPGTAMGMFYWLAEQCFVRWHQ